MVGADVVVYGKHDPLILRALKECPEWLSGRILPRLAGYPDPAKCWLWGGARKGVGYGTAALPRSVGVSPSGVTLHIGVHRAVWIATVGPIEKNYVLDHDGPHGCKNRACANPLHLQPVPNRVNVVVTSRSVSAKNARATHCPEGHPLAGDNLRPAALARGGRNCQECHLTKGREAVWLVKQASQALGLSKREYTKRHGQSRAAAVAILESHGITPSKRPDGVVSRAESLRRANAASWAPTANRRRSA